MQEFSPVENSRLYSSVYMFVTLCWISIFLMSHIEIVKDISILLKSTLNFKIVDGKIIFYNRRFFNNRRFFDNARFFNNRRFKNLYSRIFHPISLIFLSTPVIRKMICQNPFPYSELKELIPYIFLLSSLLIVLFRMVNRNVLSNTNGLKTFRDLFFFFMILSIVTVTIGFKYSILMGVSLALTVTRPIYHFILYYLVKKEVFDNIEMTYSYYEDDSIDVNSSSNNINSNSKSKSLEYDTLVDINNNVIVNKEAAIVDNNIAVEKEAAIVDNTIVVNKEATIVNHEATIVEKSIDIYNEDDDDVVIKIEKEQQPIDLTTEIQEEEVILDNAIKEEEPSIPGNLKNEIDQDSKPSQEIMNYSMEEPANQIWKLFDGLNKPSKIKENPQQNYESLLKMMELEDSKNTRKPDLKMENAIATSPLNQDESLPKKDLSKIDLPKSDLSKNYLWKSENLEKIRKALSKGWDMNNMNEDETSYLKAWDHFDNSL